MNLTAIDLNLLVALDALISEAHVGRAARRIGRSQPTTSHALKRLRTLFDDPLLVQVGSRMELTPRAAGLRESVADDPDAGAEDRKGSGSRRSRVMCSRLMGSFGVTS